MSWQSTAGRTSLCTWKDNIQQHYITFASLFYSPSLQTCELLRGHTPNHDFSHSLGTTKYSKHNHVNSRWLAKTDWQAYSFSFQMKKQKEMKRPKDPRVFQKTVQDSGRIWQIPSNGESWGSQQRHWTIVTHWQTTSVGYQKHAEQPQQVCIRMSSTAAMHVPDFKCVCVCERLSAYIHAGLWKHWIISSAPWRISFKSLNE